MQQRQDSTERRTRRTRRRPAPRLVPWLSRVLGIATLLVMLLLVGVWLIDRSEGGVQRGSAEPGSRSLVTRIERLFGLDAPPTDAVAHESAEPESLALSQHEPASSELGIAANASPAITSGAPTMAGGAPSALETGAHGATTSSAPSSADEPPRDARVSGRVVDATGGPIAGAKVRVQFLEISFAPQAKVGTPALTPRPDIEWLTDAQGRFFGLAPSGRIALTASAEAYTEARAIHRAPSEDVVLALAPGARVSGRVQRTDGSAVSGARLRIEPRGIEQAALEGTSDGRGEFSIGGVPAGVLEVTASASGLSSAREWLRLGVGEAAAPLLFTLAPAHTVHGVVRVSDGSPCAEGIVRLDGQMQQLREIDARGYYRFDGLDEGTHELAVTCPGMATALRSIPVSADSPASIELNWQLDPGFSLAGSIRRKNGEPLAGALVWLHAVAAPTGDGSSAQSDALVSAMGSSCRPDGAGEFECGGLRAGWYQVNGGSSSGARASSNPVRVDAQTKAWVDLIIPDSGEVRVRVADGASLGEHFVRGVFAHGADTFPIPASARGDRFVFEDLALGRYRIAIGRAATEPGPSAVDVELTQPDQVIDVELHAPEIMTIGGTVVDENGAPVPDAWVQAALAEPGFPLLQSAAAPVLTNTEGRFELGDLPAGRYAVSARHAGGEAHALDVSTGQRDVRLVVEAYGSLSGRVTAADAQPARRFSVIAIRETAGEPLHVDGEHGRWSLPWVSPGAYRVIITSESGGAATNALVTSGSDTALEARLDPALAGRRISRALKAGR